ncbi:MAG: tRNA 2-selenouridine(34) synthase MnmH [Proteobacteria bacterium]|nr:tRNA 2-selenouridine(34) synthase MnmH [Pseudomonadota bacterium]
MKRDLHKSTNPQASIDEAWNLKVGSVIDVRSPAEFDSGHMPNAVNIPLLANNERKTVGILYKEFGRDKAIDQGYQFAGSKLNYLSEQYETLRNKPAIIVYCARGGMRSQVVTAFLRHLGFPARQMTGGYKGFRNWNLQQLDQFKINHPIVLHGQTGVGKTLVLDRLSNSLDLEQIAAHRGSIIGALGKKPVTQKTFEAELLKKLLQLDNSKAMYIEGESRKIGDVSIPNSIFSQMRASKALLLEASMKTRVARTVDEYITKQPDHKHIVRKTIFQLTNDLGKKPIARLIDLFDTENYAECFEYILTNYYDRKYSHSMKKFNFARKISTENLDQARNEILDFANSII